MLVRTEVCVGSLVAWKPCVTCPAPCPVQVAYFGSPLIRRVIEQGRFIYKSAIGL